MHCMIHIQNLVYYRKFRHIQAYSCSIQTYSVIFWHIQNLLQLLHIHNPSIFRILTYIEPKIPAKIHSELCQGMHSGIFRMLHIAPILRTLPYFNMFRVLAYLGPEEYSESSLYRHTQTYSDIFNNNSYNNINFFSLYLTYFSTKFKGTLMQI